MLMVVFGAGASYDSVPARLPSDWPPARLPERPPLANELFDDRPLFAQAMARFPKCQPVVPYLQHRPEDVSVERVLERLQAEADEYPERYRQLAAIRYYLHFVIWETELHWNDVARGATNYKTFLDQLERWRKPQEPICLVTFNYDRMLESALPSVGVQINRLEDYVAGEKYKVIKLHGSVHWAREVDTVIDNLNERNVWQVAYELIDRATDLDVSQKYCMVVEHPIGKSDRSALFPAVAIPVEKKSAYECPLEHLEVLETCIPEVTKLILIGWRGTDVSFLELLAKKFQREVEGIVVAGGEDEARQVAAHLQQAGIMGRFNTAKGGFSDFVVLRQADEFLRC